MDIAAALNYALSIIIGVLILALLVATHEFGHGVVARRNGVRVKEFGIGFPPRIKGWNVKKSVLGKDVLYSLNWLPFGGFVNLQGESDSANNKGDFGMASFWSKTKILFAGVMVNWVTAAVLFSILAAVGMPKLINGQFTVPVDTVVNKQPTLVGSVVKGTPADKAGLQAGDELVSVAGVNISDATKLTELTKANKGKTIPIVYERDGSKRTVEVALRANNDDQNGYLGLAGEQKTTYRSTWSSPVVGVVLTGQLTVYTFQSLGQTLANLGMGLIGKVTMQSSADNELAQANNNVSGPLLVVGKIFPAARADGNTSLVLITALIALGLAVMNALPIPALDGGRWFVTFLYHKVLHRPLTKEKEEKIHGTGFIVMLGLVAFITILDIFKMKQW